MRPHAFEIALLGRANGIVSVNDVLRVEVREPTTYVPAAIGKACPHVVYPNLNDHGYLKVKLDDRSVNNLKYSLNEVQDPMLRHQLWYAVWDKVRDAEFSYVSFSDLLVPEAIAKETNDLMLRQLTFTAGSVVNYYRHTPSLKDKQASTFTDRLDREIWQRLKTAKGGSNDQLVWFESVANTFSSPWGLEQIKDLLNGKQTLAGLKIDQDRRWILVNTLARFNDKDALALIDREAKKDTSSEGLEQKMSSLAARPVWEEKMKWVEEYKLPKSTYSFSQQRAAFSTLFPANQFEMRERFSEQFFKDLTVVNKTKENFIAGLFTRLAPFECSINSAGKIKAYLEKNSDLQPGLIKNLKIMAQEGERCRNVVAYAEKANQVPAPAQ